MTDQKLQWNKCTTLSTQNINGLPTAKVFLWAADMTWIYIKSNRTIQKFSHEDYQAMISHVTANRNGVPLGARRDHTVPENSLGALMEKRSSSQSIRGWCSHLAAIAVRQDHLNFSDMGRGRGRGIFLYPKKAP